MKILYIHYKEPGYRPGGMEVHIVSSSEALRALGHQVSVLPMLGEDNHSTIASVAPARERSAFRKQLGRFVFEPRCFVRMPSRWPRLRRAIRDFEPDVLFLRYSPFEWTEFLLARTLGLPLVVEVNATTFEIRQWKSSEVYLYPLTSPLETAVLNSADGMLVVSEGLKRLLVKQGVRAELITINPNGADPVRLSAAGRAESLRKRLGFDGAIVVGFLGSFARWYDWRTIVEVVVDVVRTNANVRVLFAGGHLADLPPGLRTAFQAVADKVVFTGPFPVAQAAEYLGAIDIGLSLFPKIEPFNASVVKQFEYMAAGKGIVATAIGQQAELIEDGINGLLVPPHDVVAARSAVQRLIDDPALLRRIGVAARDSLLANYTWTHNAARIAAVCEIALQRRAVQPRNPGVVCEGSETRANRAGTLEDA